MIVQFTAGAIRQVAEIAQRIARDDPFTAHRFTDEIAKLAELAVHHRGIGRATRVPGLRVFPLKPYPYLVFYPPAKSCNGVEVISVRHMARKQDWRRGR